MGFEGIEEINKTHGLFFRNGLVKNKSKYMNVEIDVNKKHCLYTKPIAPWITICSDEDNKCRGNSDCNDLECMVDGKLLQNDAFT